MKLTKVKKLLAPTLTAFLFAIGLNGNSQPLMPITPETRTPSIEMKIIKNSYSEVTTGIYAGRETYSFASFNLSAPLLEGVYFSAIDTLRKLGYKIYPDCFLSLKNLHVMLGGGIESKNGGALQLRFGLEENYANENSSFTIEATLGGYFSNNKYNTILTYYFGMERDINNFTPFTVFGFNATEDSISLNASAGFRYHMPDGSSLLLSVGTPIPEMNTSAAISYNKNNVAITFSGNTKEFKFSIDASF